MFGETSDGSNVIPLPNRWQGPPIYNPNSGGVVTPTLPPGWIAFTGNCPAGYSAQPIPGTQSPGGGDVLYQTADTQITAYGCQPMTNFTYPQPMPVIGGPLTVGQALQPPATGSTPTPAATAPSASSGLLGTLQNTTILGIPLLYIAIGAAVYFFVIRKK